MARLRSAPGSSQAGRPIAADSQLLLIDRSAKPVRRPRSGAGGLGLATCYRLYFSNFSNFDYCLADDRRTQKHGRRVMMQG
jgi:hypothetical protein